MALLQLSEPGQASQPHQRKLAVGIDLGTTNSLVATVRNAFPEVLTDLEGRAILPSVVHYGEERVTVGWDAREWTVSDPLNTIVSAKRLMGRGVNDLKKLSQHIPCQMRQQESGGMPYIKTVRGEMSPVEVSAEILRVLRSRGEESLGGELDGAVITVPAYFDEAQRQATKDAAKLAGLKLLRLLNEPTAAAVAYGLDKGDEGVVAIYDLGGGTFDITIIRMHGGVYEVLATAGDTALGGDDFDRVIAEWILAESDYTGNLTPELSRDLFRVCCAAKEALSSDTVTTIVINLGGREWRAELTRELFDQLSEELVSQTLRVCRRALRDARIKAPEISNVVMVGGSTRIPVVRDQVTGLFGREPLVDIDPDQVVAVGAALQADVLVGNKSGDDMLLLDVNPLSLGIETMGGLVEKIIPRNATLPIARAQEFTTYKDGQTAMAIHVLQGEREMVADCRSLARFELQGIPAMVAGAARIEVTFQVDADGLLNVSATELSTGTRSSIQVKPSYGLSDTEISRMISESIEHAREDVDLRKLGEAKVSATALLESLEHALTEDGEELLSAAEREQIQAAMTQLGAAAAGDDLAAILRETETTSNASNEFATRRMDSSIKKALAGKSLDEIQMIEEN